MLDNDFVYELNIEIDRDELDNIVQPLLLRTQRGFQHFTKDFPYLEHLRSLYPILGERWSLYRLKVAEGLPAHVDAKRQTCINIPYSGCDDTFTVFYQKQDYGKITTYDEFRVAHVFNQPEQLEETYRFTLNHPTLMDNTIPHSVQAGKHARLSISWGIPNMNFQQAKEYLRSTI